LHAPAALKSPAIGGRHPWRRLRVERTRQLSAGIDAVTLRRGLTSRPRLQSTSPRSSRCSSKRGRNTRRLSPPGRKWGKAALTQNRCSLQRGSLDHLTVQRSFCHWKSGVSWSSRLGSGSLTGGCEHGSTTLLPPNLRARAANLGRQSKSIYLRHPVMSP
jgi:hypothetical protein